MKPITFSMKFSWACVCGNVNKDKYIYEKINHKYEVLCVVCERKWILSVYMKEENKG